MLALELIRTIMNNSSESLNFKIRIMGQQDRPPCNLRPLNLEKLLEWIDAKTVEPAIKEELKRMAGSYPEAALTNWAKNYTKHLAKAKKKVKLSQFPKPSVEDHFSEEK